MSILSHYIINSSKVKCFLRKSIDSSQMNCYYYNTLQPFRSELNKERGNFYKGKIILSSGRHCRSARGIAGVCVQVDPAVE